MAEINLHGQIGGMVEGEGVTAASFAQSIKDVDSDEPLTIFVNSPGGSVFDGLTIYQSLVSRAGENHFVIQGVAASIASVIPMAGDTITMAQSSRFMIHDPMGPSAMAFGTSGDLRDAAEDTLKTARLLDSIKETLVDVYASRTGGDRSVIAKQMQDETWLTAGDAVEAGFADKVLPNKSIAAAAILNPVAHRAKDIGELAAIGELCRTLKLRNRRLPSAPKLRLAKAKLDELARSI